MNLKTSPYSPNSKEAAKIRLKVKTSNQSVGTKPESGGLVPLPLEECLTRTSFKPLTPEITTNIETTTKMLEELGLTEKELQDVRDTCDMLAEIVVEGWFEKHKRARNPAFHTLSTRKLKTEALPLAN